MSHSVVVFPSDQTFPVAAEQFLHYLRDIVSKSGGDQSDRVVSLTSIHTFVDQSGPGNGLRPWCQEIPDANSILSMVPAR